MPRRLRQSPTQPGGGGRAGRPTPFDNIRQMERAFGEQLAGFDREGKQAALDTWNGAIERGATVEDAIRMAIGSAKAFSRGQRTGRSPATTA